jgi:hypothetical protein
MEKLFINVEAIESIGMDGFIKTDWKPIGEKGLIGETNPDPNRQKWTTGIVDIGIRTSDLLNDRLVYKDDAWYSKPRCVIVTKSGHTHKKEFETEEECRTYTQSVIAAMATLGINTFCMNKD